MLKFIFTPRFNYFDLIILALFSNLVSTGESQNIVIGCIMLVVGAGISVITEQELKK